MNIRECAENFLKFFKLTDKPRRMWVMTDNVPDYVKDMVFKAHADALPHDWIFKKVVRSLEGISKQGEDFEPLTDVYTYDLLDWLAHVPGAMQACDDANDEGFNKADSSMFDRLAHGQYFMLDRIKSTVMHALEKECENDTI